MIFFVNREKDKQTLFLIRGLPGSGKTTLARRLHNVATISADDFFYLQNCGKYKFDASKLSEAHQYCQDQTLLCLELGVSVAVHNTFSQSWEARPYFEMAQKLNVQVQIIECQGNFGSVHGVPKETIEKMKDRWEKTLIFEP